MPAQYYDTPETLRAKQACMEKDAQKYIAQILIAEVDAKTIRKEIRHLCVSARSWCYHTGRDVFGYEASEHAKAMRQCLIAEMRIWLAALRRMRNTNN